MTSCYTNHFEGLAGLGLLLIKGPPTRIRLPGLHMIGYLLREDWTRDLV